MEKSLDLNIDSNGIARLVFDLKGEKINKLSLPVLNELQTVLEGIRNDKRIKALVVSSAKPGVFIAGADLKSFDRLFQDFQLAEEMIKKGHAVFNQLERLPFPTIAIINGACLGGGLELALACTYRVVGDHPRTSLGLPETTLGIFPGWGGTQRLPRLVGLTEGLQLVLTGQPVNAQKAVKIHLTDAIFSPEFLPEKSEEFVKMILTEKGKASVLSRRKRSGLLPFLLEKNPLGRALVFWQAKRTLLQKTKGYYPSPVAALELIKETFTLPLEEGLKKEREAFVKGMSSYFRYAPNLIYLYFNSEAMKKDSGFPSEYAKKHPIRSVGVLGAGVMGSGIAWLFSYRDLPVRMKDVNWEAVGKGYKAAWEIYKILIKKRRLTPQQASQKFLRIGGTTDYEGFGNLDLVIEAAVENLELKQKLLQELERHLKPEAIIGTNTSSLRIDELAKVMRYPERLVGIHFFNPPSIMPLVEIVAGSKTAPEVVQAAFELALSLKKTPIVVGDCSGFLVNRVFGHGFVEIIRMLEEGVPMERLDRLFLKFGLPMAPFVLADEIGNDVNLKAMKSFEKAYGARMKVPPILEKVNERALYGKKVGKGFYLYHNSNVKPNPEIVKLLPRDATQLSDDEIIDRVMLSMINEAARCLEEGVVTHPGYLDMALVYGVGFPPFRGGLLRYADSIGIRPLMEKFNQFQAVYGDRYAPCNRLKEMERGRRLFLS